jgi:hypothetical protein
MVLFSLMLPLSLFGIIYEPSDILNLGKRSGSLSDEFDLWYQQNGGFQYNMDGRFDWFRAAECEMTYIPGFSTWSQSGVKSTDFWQSFFAWSSGKATILRERVQFPFLNAFDFSWAMNISMNSRKFDAPEAEFGPSLFDFSDASVYHETRKVNTGWNCSTPLITPAPRSRRFRSG